METDRSAACEVSRIGDFDSEITDPKTIDIIISRRCNAVSPELRLSCQIENHFAQVSATSPVTSPLKTSLKTLLSDTELDSINMATLDIAASEYARLKKAGQPITDADLLIGAYRMEKGYTLVTNNVKRLSVINGLNTVNRADTL
jgi:hypothetical protein